MEKEAHSVNIRMPKPVYLALLGLAKDNGTRVSIEARKAIVDRLKQKGKLNKDKNYL